MNLDLAELNDNVSIFNQVLIFNNLLKVANNVVCK